MNGNVILDINCACGRRKPHCHACGSHEVYARTVGARVDRMPDGTDVTIMGYSCRKCGQRYTADAPCAAPPPKEKYRREKNRREGHTDDYEPTQVKPDSEVVNRLVEDLKALNPARYGHIKTASEPEDEGSVTDTSQDEFFGRK